MSIPNRFSKGNDIRNHMLELETPKMFANPAETNLNLICNTKPSCRSNYTVGVFQKITRKRHLTSTAKD